MTATAAAPTAAPPATAYDDTRPGGGPAGGPALLCLPGWCGDRTVFDPLLPLAAPARRVLSMDLPGHGGAPRPAEDFGTAAVVDTAAAVVEAAGVGRVVPVALSHAGWAALGLRRRLGPQRVPAVVLLDWMVLGPPPGFLDALDGLRRPGSWEQVRAGLFGMWTEGVDVPAVHRYVASMAGYGPAMWARAGREIAAAFRAEPSPLAALARLPGPCPTLHVYAQPADDAYLAAQQGYAAAHPWFRVHRLDARSHFPTLEAPGRVAAAVEAFLRDVA